MSLPKGAIQVAVVSFITITLSIISLGLRLWSRQIQRLPLVFSDYMAIVAMVFTAGTVSVFLAAGFAAGLGTHLNEILATDPQIFALHLKIFVPAQLLWAAANTSVKFSILSLYTILFPNKKFGYICYATMMITTAYFIMVLLETFLLCKPVQYSWDKSIPGGRCEGENLAYLIAGITNLVIDAFIVALPMPMLFGLQLSMSKRFSLAGMFSLGAVICIMSLMRVLWLQSWDLADMTYTVTPGAIYSVLEPTLGVVNACLPTIKPAITRLFKSRRPGGYEQQSSSVKSSSAIGDRKLPSTIKNLDNGNFQRLDDHIPLTSIYSGNRSGNNFHEEEDIIVTTEWRVGRSHQGNPTEG